MQARIISYTNIVWKPVAIQRYSEKKVKKLAELTGLPLEMVWNGPNGGPERIARTIIDGQCKHYIINVFTGEWREDPDCWHMTTCPREDKVE